MPATKSLQPRAYRVSSKMGKKKERDGRKGQICECVILAQLVVLMKRPCECFKNKDHGAPTKIKLDPLCRPMI